MANETKIVSYSRWKPAITPEKIFAEIVVLGSITVIGEKYYLTELRLTEKGRTTLVSKDSMGKITDILPSNFNIRTRVHEYGGKSHEFSNKYFYFSNFQDQRIYRKTLNDSSDPVPLTSEKISDDSLGKYAVPVLTPDEKSLVFVFEKEFKDRENENFLGLLDLTKELPNEPEILAQGRDFYFDPQISPDGTKIMWIEYDHPNMPWTSTELMIADLKENKILQESKKIVAGGEGISVCAPRFDKSGKAYFVMDEENHQENNPKNWYNIYSFDGETVEPVTQELAEFAGPAWGLGDCNYQFLPDGKIIANFEKEGEGFLCIINPQTRELKKLDSPFVYHSGIQVLDENSIVFFALSKFIPPALVKMNLISMDYEIIKQCYTHPLKNEDLSIAEVLPYPTSDGQKAFAQYYKPRNSQYQAPDGENPPLIVMVHGGPTGRTSPHFSISKQFWTSQGYAILDVDHRGSTSYGRKYRDALKGKWGVIDAQDIKDGVDFLLKEREIDEKIAITGGSAGGYAVQRALTMFPETFHVGASYFGIGNLLTLVKLTHKFESRYMDWCVGASLPEGEERFKERSPINYMDRLKSPMILFQGAEDKVVTPVVSREIANILKEKGIKSDYIEYEGESHGFRKKESNIDALNREAEFFRSVLFP